MIFALRTDSDIAELSLVDGDRVTTVEWAAGREMARGLLGRITLFLKDNSIEWSDVSGIVVYKGPGSYTGLRIGCTVMNATAYAKTVPIVGETGDDWRATGIDRLKKGENQKVVTPYYAKDPHITQAKR